MPTTRTLARMVKRMEVAGGMTERQVAERRRLDHERAVNERIMASPAACHAMDRAAAWVARNVLLGADVRDYPEAVRLMGEVEAELAGDTCNAIVLASECLTC